MVLKIYTSTNLQREPKLVFESATKKEIELRRQADKDYVLMTKERYLKLIGK